MDPTTLSEWFSDLSGRKVDKKSDSAAKKVEKTTVDVVATKKVEKSAEIGPKKTEKVIPETSKKVEKVAEEENSPKDLPDTPEPETPKSETPKTGKRAARPTPSNSGKRRKHWNVFFSLFTRLLFPFLNVSSTYFFLNIKKCFLERSF